MSYSTVANVRSIIITDMTDAQIADVITWVDEVIKLRLVVALYTADFLEGVSALYAAWRCMLRDPNAQSLGEYSENRNTAITLMKDELDELLGNTASGIVPLGGGVKLVASMEPI